MVWFMSGEISKIFNRLITAFMLVAVLIACEKTPERQSIQTQPSSLIINNYQ